MVLSRLNSPEVNTKKESAITSYGSRALDSVHAIPYALDNISDPCPGAGIVPLFKGTAVSKPAGCGRGTGQSNSVKGSNWAAPMSFLSVVLYGSGEENGYEDLGFRIARLRQNNDFP
jgi:hypothetical protein